jgi:hypothetical protein
VPSSDRLEVILDSGATAHMFSSTIIFQTYKDISNQGRRVSLGDKDIQLLIIGQGRVEFLGESLYVPKLKFGLISISYFDQQGFSIVVRDNIIQVFDLNDRLHIEGHLNNNLYYLNDEYIDKMLYTGHTRTFTGQGTTESCRRAERRGQTIV